MIMARVVEGFHSATCTPTSLSTNRTNHTYLCLPSRTGFHLPIPEGRKAELAQAPPQWVNSPSRAANWQLSHLIRRTHDPQAASRDANHWATSLLRQMTPQCGVSVTRLDVQKRLNRSRSCSAGRDSSGPKAHCITRESRSPYTARGLGVVEIVPIVNYRTTAPIRRGLR